MPAEEEPTSASEPKVAESLEPQTVGNCTWGLICGCDGYETEVHNGEVRFKQKPAFIYGGACFMFVYCVLNLLTFCRTVTPFSSRSHERKNESRQRSDCEAFKLLVEMCQWHAPFFTKKFFHLR